MRWAAACGLLILFLPLSVALGQDASREDSEFFKTRLEEIKGLRPVLAQYEPGMPPPKCGTPVTIAAFDILNRTSDNDLKALLARPSDALVDTLRPRTLPDTLGGVHILLHYTTTGSNAIRTNPPGYLDSVLAVFEHVWQVEVESLGYSSPPADFGRGGDNRYDVYILNLGFGYFGFTTPESTIQNYRAFSFITIENDFAESGYSSDPVSGLKVTAAHEFFHAIQFGYDAYEFDFLDPDNNATYKPWWLEASSTWMEDVVYDSINDYVGYLRFFYKYMWMSLGAFSYGGDARAFHPYASCVWPIYLTEKYQDLDIMRQIWNICGSVGGYNTLPATNTVLNAYGTNLQNAFLDFEIWNFHTGVFADPNRYFSEGSQFPEAETTAYISDLTAEPSFTIPNNIRYPEHLAANYIIMRSVADASGGVVANFDGQDISGQEWRVALLGFKSGDSRYQDMQVGPFSGDGAGAWLGWNSYRCVVLVPTVSGQSANYSSFTYGGTLNYDPNLAGGGTPDLRAGQAYPSPYIIAASDSVTIPYSLDKSYAKKDLGLWIYDLSGNLVREIPGEKFLFTDPGEYKSGIRWDGRNENGEYVASGIYIYLLEAEGKSATGKMAVINRRN